MSDEIKPSNPALNELQKRIKELEDAQNALAQSLGGDKRKKYVRFFVAALSSIPWVGGLFSASASFSAEMGQEKINDLHRLWLAEHEEKARELIATLMDIFDRLDNFGDEIQGRVESPEFLTLVRKTFKAWDEADTEEKRQMLKKLILNAGAIKLCSDDLVRLFTSWIELYHELHFAVIKEIYRDPGITRGEMWDVIRGARPRDDSAEADLFKLLIRDLSTGGVIRQEREVDSQGRFRRKRRSPQSRAAASGVMETPFEETKPYVLTELGKQFIHYVMEDVAPQLGGKPATAV
ncbi:MAG: hypothetical protein LAO76_02325 [Acidobacteriia bacterium]|jgi:hypothetical protein|nr:hypothetical protein [Terriglobia bacterium]